jgi:ATP synthase protein I
MSSMKPIYRRLLMFTAVLFCCLTVMWFLFPFYKECIAGVILGFLVSCYNVLFLNKKMRIAEKYGKTRGSMKQHGTGMIHRFCVVALAIFFAYKNPEVIDVRTIVIGLPLCYLFLIFSELITVRRQVFSSRKG